MGFIGSMGFMGSIGFIGFIGSMPGNLAVGRVDRNYENICGIARGNPA
jgi:hypothetical protein